MKSNKGITLISLIIYIIVLTIVVGIISVFTKYFYKNTDETVISNKVSEQYTIFLSYITDDINSGNIDSVEVDASGKYINFYFLDNSVHQYAYDANSKKIYYLLYDSEYVKQKQIAICEEVEDNTSFSYENNKLKTKITIDSITYNNIFNIK